MSNSLMVVGCLLGMDVRICDPQSLLPENALVEKARSLTEKSDARLTITSDISQAVHDVDYIHTDVWVSMREPKEVWDKRIKLLKDYQVNAAMIEKCGNPAVKFMHCLPSFHNRETTVGEDINQKTGMDGLEVTDDVFKSPWSIIFDQAENRMHTIKAVMVAALGDWSCGD